MPPKSNRKADARPLDQALATLSRLQATASDSADDARFMAASTLMSHGGGVSRSSTRTDSTCPPPPQTIPTPPTRRQHASTQTTSPSSSPVVPSGGDADAIQVAALRAALADSERRAAAAESALAAVVSAKIDAMDSQANVNAGVKKMFRALREHIFRSAAEAEAHRVHMNELMLRLEEDVQYRVVAVRQLRAEVERLRREHSPLPQGAAELQ